MERASHSKKASPQAVPQPSVPFPQPLAWSHERRAAQGVAEATSPQTDGFFPSSEELANLPYFAPEEEQQASQPTEEGQQTQPTLTEEEQQTLQELGFEIIEVLDEWEKEEQTAATKAIEQDVAPETPVGEIAQNSDEYVLEGEIFKATAEGIFPGPLRQDFVEDMIEFIEAGVVSLEVGLFLMSIVPTESSGGDWTADNRQGHYGAFQLSANDIADEGVTVEQFIGNPRIQVVLAAEFYGKKLDLVRAALSGDLDGMHESEGWIKPEGQNLSDFLADKHELYQVAYAWLSLAGEDGNNTLSRNYAKAALLNALAILDEYINSDAPSPFWVSPRALRGSIERALEELE